MHNITDKDLKKNINRIFSLCVDMNCRKKSRSKTSEDYLWEEDFSSNNFTNLSSLNSLYQVFYDSLKHTLKDTPHYYHRNPISSRENASSIRGESSYSIQFGRLYLVADDFHYGDINVYIIESENKREHFGTLSHNTENLEKTMLALTPFELSYTKDIQNYLEVLVGFLLLVKAFYVLGSVKLPVGAWVPSVDISAVQCLDLYGIANPVFKPISASCMSNHDIAVNNDLAI